MDNSNNLTKKQLLDSMFKSYTDNEVKEELEKDQWGPLFVAFNDLAWWLMRVAVNFNDFVHGNRSVSKCSSFSDLLLPSREADENYLDVLLEKWRDLMLELKRVPDTYLEIVNSASRSFVTFLDKLKGILATFHMHRVKIAFERIVSYLVGILEAPTNELEFEHRIEQLFQELSENFKEGVLELSVFESQFRRQLEKNNAPYSLAEKRKVFHFEKKTRERVVAIWNEAQLNSQVKCSCTKSRITHKAAFNFYRKRLAVEEIFTLNDFNRCLESERNRRNYARKTLKKN